MASSAKEQARRLLIRGSLVRVQQPGQLGSASRLAAARPASAVASSLSDASPVTPTAPIIALSSPRISTPPGTGIKDPPTAWVAAAMKYGCFSAGFPTNTIPRPLPARRRPCAHERGLHIRVVHEHPMMPSAIAPPPPRWGALNLGQAFEGRTEPTPCRIERGPHNLARPRRRYLAKLSLKRSCPRFSARRPFLVALLLPDSCRSRPAENGSTPAQRCE